MTFALFGCSVLLTAAFLAWVPRRRTWFTVLGAGTICGYLLHGFLTKGAQYSGLIDAYAWLHAPAGKVLLSVVAAAAVTVLCTPPVRRVLRPVTEPDLAWAFRRDPAERSAKGSAGPPLSLRRTAAVWPVDARPAAMPHTAVIAAFRPQACLRPVVRHACRTPVGQMPFHEKVKNCEWYAG